MKKVKDNSNFTRTRNIQMRAADPLHSVWVAANAGSGKTHVLTQRVVRLLQQGTPPARILCLTFTKAAAANMSRRVFEQLSRWALLDDEALKAAIIEVGSPTPKPHELEAARRLFARTIETPGGLKIQTIHSFCERILHQFPFEANVPAAFEVIEPERVEELIQMARDQALNKILNSKDSPEAAALTQISPLLSENGFSKIVHEAQIYRQTILSFDSLAEQRLSDSLECQSGDQLEKIWHDLFSSPHRQNWHEWIEIAQTSSSKDQAFAQKLAQCSLALATNDFATAHHYYLSLFYNQKSEIRNAFLTKTLIKKFSFLEAQLQTEFDHIQVMERRRKALQTFQRSRALILILRVIFKNYEALKRHFNTLDYEDLIERTRRLLHSSSAGWVHYKLDQGIDHILVDEAQDTSPAQWDIIAQLASEFWAGDGAKSSTRSLFAVGDEKQSIYSFQGAEPAMFDEMARRVEKSFEQCGKNLRRLALTLSFRSSPIILKAVDAIFQGENYRGLSSDGAGKTLHQALHQNLPGLIEIWPLFTNQKEIEPQDWQLPVDAVHRDAPAPRLADAISRKIGQLIQPGSPERVCDKNGNPRPILAGDILIQVRKRGPIFEEVIKSLKAANIPVAGADRLFLTQHIAVMDLMALARFVLLPEDDLNLAALLKSPLVGLTDGDLMILAPRRHASLWQALEENSSYQEIYQRMKHWQATAKRQRPFAFFSYILNQESGRKALISRLGEEARDAIDEFLRLALNHEQQNAPSLARFIGRLEQSDIEIKRDLEAAGAAVRVMTVHAAKGLEAKIVFLPDTVGEAKPRHPSPFLRLPNTQRAELTPLWSINSSQDCSAITQAKSLQVQLELEEHRRLLYVALTRAEERLYISAYGAENFSEYSWYAMIINALDDQLTKAPTPDDFNGPIRTLGEGLKETASLALQPPPLNRPIPEWVKQPMGQEPILVPPISPSRAIDAADLLPIQPDSTMPRDKTYARLRGNLVHKLLQILPQVIPEKQKRLGYTLLPDDLTAQTGLDPSELVEEAIRLIASPDLAPLFQSNSQGEVAIAGTIVLPNKRPLEVSGQIDRLCVRENDLWIAEFKSGQPKSQIPKSYSLQLALYSALCETIFPHKILNCRLVWTQNGQIVIIDAQSRQAILRDSFVDS